MVTAISTAINPKTTTKRGPASPSPRNPTRPPLLPSESDNALSPRRPKPPQVTSRYMSPSPSSSISRRCHSPLRSTAMNSASMVTPPPQSLTKRSLSVERTRTPNPRSKSSYVGVGNGAGIATPAAQKMLFTSTRSLTVSFQGESFSIQVSKEKPAPSPNFRKITPERRKATTPARGRSASTAQTEISRPIDQQRWPARMRRANCMTTSVDCEDDMNNSGGSRDVVKSLQNLMLDVQDGTTSSGLDNGEIKKVADAVLERKNGGGSELIPSDNESVYSGSSSDGGERGSRGIVVPARFWQEANNRLRQQTDPASPSSRNAGNKVIAPPRHLYPKNSGLDSPITSPRKLINSRGQVSPIRAAVRPASPSKLPTPSTSSPLRGVSPSRVRNGVTSSLSNRLSNVPSILSFVVDVRRGKIGENRIVDAHLLRLLYNKLLQWRFVNARADSALSAQRLNAEKDLYNAWVATSKLRESVRAKRTELKLLKQHFKLISILKEQITFLEDWALLDRGYSSSLSGAIEALKASTLRLPVVGGAKADVLNVKDAICSAMDVMQAMASSICLLSPKVGHVNSLVLEVANVSAKELVLLDECKNLLSIIASLQVLERSLRTHILQLKCLPETQQ